MAPHGEAEKTGYRTLSDPRCWPAGRRRGAPAGGGRAEGEGASTPGLGRLAGAINRTPGPVWLTAGDYTLSNQPMVPFDNTKAGMREGKIERAIREHLAAHPDEAFSTDELAEHCFPDARPIARKHRVSVLRVARKVVTADPDWAWYVAESHGGSLVFFNQGSVPSRAMRTSWPSRR